MVGAAALAAALVEPASPGDAALIWLHGLGASGEDFVPLMPALGLPPSVRCIMPQAPEQPVALNQGMMMPSWYDIGEDGAGGHWLDMRALERSARQIAALVRQQCAQGVPAERIILAGFSQGAALAAQVALGYDRPLGGLLMLSGFLPRPDGVRRHQANAALPCMVQHGRMDELVPVARAEDSATLLRAWGHPCELQLFDCGHELAQEQVAAISLFLHGCLDADARRVQDAPSV